MLYRTLYIFLLSLICCTLTRAQTPVGPATTHTDATRPPATEQRQAGPESSRPNSIDPTAPPSAERPLPQAPPGGNLYPQTAPSTKTEVKSRLIQASPDGASSGAQTKQDPSGQTPGATNQTPLLDSLQPRTVPPLPSLLRFGIKGVQTLPLSLNEAIRRALENNNDIALARDDVRLAESALHAAEGVYEPIFQITPQFSSFVTPQSSTLGGAGQSGTVSQTLIDAGPSILKAFRTGGGQYQFFFNNTRATTNSTNAQLSPTYSGNLGLTFTQPLLRNRAIDLNRREIRVRRKQISQSDEDFRRRTIDVITQVQSAYWDLVFALRDQQNQVNNLNLIREQFVQTEQRIEAGATAPLERAEVQTQLSNRQSELLLATQLVTLAENNLKQLILRDTLAPEWSISLIPTETPSFDADTPISSDDVLAEARANRPELHRLKLQQEISDIDLDYYRNQMRPRVDLQATISTTGLAGMPLNPVSNVTPQTLTVPENLIGGYGRMVQNLLSLNTRNIVVGVAIQLPFHNQTARANLASARIQREQLATTMRTQEQGVEVEVRNAGQAAETARLRVLAARDARQNAEVQLEGERRLFALGRSTTFLLFQRENQLADARNLELRVETDYNKALAILQRATSSTLRANHVVVEAVPDRP